jgi:ArsR family transcriptional regulator, arsenate/arsenite/antimonite-responsive transcriptional repressor
MDTLAGTFKALSDETRLRIMTLLLEHDELCVCDFVGALGQTQSKVSRHLRYLYNSGLVQDRREGLWMHYRISPALRPEQAIIITALSQAVGEEMRQELHLSLEQWFARKASAAAAQGQGAASCC